MIIDTYNEYIKLEFRRTSPVFYNVDNNLSIKYHKIPSFTANKQSPDGH